MDMMSSDVPPLFICPISLEIMKDPVTISTGLTFDRENIHKWIFQYNQNSCPVTKQILSDQFLTPNSNLLRLIESWLVQYRNPALTSAELESHNQVSVSATTLRQLMDELKQYPNTSQRKSSTLRKIKLLIQENDNHRSYVVDGDIDCLVASLLIETDLQYEASDDHSSEITELAVTLLNYVKLPNEKLKKLSQYSDGKMITIISSIIVHHRSYHARIQAASLLKSIFRVADDICKSQLKIEFFEGIAEILKDNNSIRGSLAALLILIEVLPHDNNRSKAVEVGIVSILVELLSETYERRLCEIILHGLYQLCKGAEGRSAFLAHPVGVAAVSSKILRISHIANDCGVSVLSSLFRFCKTSIAAKELLEVGGVAKMCTVLQSGCCSRTKDKARAIVEYYFKSSSVDHHPCLPSHFSMNNGTEHILN